jgi:dienelactone hydrolase
MGRMVADVRWAVDELSSHELIDPDQIFVAGYSLGGTVGLYSAALDDRIAGVISVAGFTPMKGNSITKTTEGIYEFSHLHGLLPRLGFFAGKEERIPYDYYDILAAIAPRPIMVIAPKWDQYSSFEDIQKCVVNVEKVYELYQQKNNLTFVALEDYNRFSGEMKIRAIEWLQHNKK